MASPPDQPPGERSRRAAGRLSRSERRMLATRAVQLYLEVATGRRPPRTVRHLVTPDVADWLKERRGALAAQYLDRTPAWARRSSGLAQPRVRRIQVLPRDEPSVIDVVALIEDHQQRISVITAALTGTARGWRVSALEHLDHGRHVTHPDRSDDLARLPSAGASPLTALKADIAIVRGAAAHALLDAESATSPAATSQYKSVAEHLQERAIKLVDQLAPTVRTELASVRAAARQAEVQAEQAPDRRSSERLGDQKRRLGRRAKALHAELDVATSATPRTPIDRGDRRGVEALLGPRPATEIGQRAWDDAAATIRAYRSTWDVTDNRRPLGPLPPPGPQRDARDQMVQTVKAKLQEICNADIAALGRTAPAIYDPFVPKPPSRDIGVAEGP